MNTGLIFLFSFLAIAVVIFMLIKKLDIKITLFTVGIILMFISVLGGAKILEEPVAKGLDPIISVVDAFKSILSGPGLVILLLGGYTSYMNKIGANEITVNSLTKPLKGIKSTYLLVPIVFLLGNLLSLVVPSASNLAIILLATLYPVLKKSGLTTLTAAGVIATTATIMPTPLGADNVAIAAELGMPVAEYVFKYHAIVSIPTLILIAFVHYFWQKYMDKKSLQDNINESDAGDIKVIKGGDGFKFVYTILPLLPIIILLISFIFNNITGSSISLTVEVVSIISFIIAIICELFREKNFKNVLDGTESFFKGMGNAMGIVALLVAATTFVNGLKAIGIIEQLQSYMETASVSGIMLPLILVLFTVLIVLLSGSGTALFYAMVPLMVPLATAAKISPFAVTVPMGLAGNLLRAVSPVSAVVMIVAGTTKKLPTDIVKRTCIPMLAGLVFMFILSMIIFL